MQHKTDVKYIQTNKTLRQKQIWFNIGIGSKQLEKVSPIKVQFTSFLWLTQNTDRRNNHAQLKHVKTNDVTETFERSSTITFSFMNTSTLYNNLYTTTIPIHSTNW